MAEATRLLDDLWSSYRLMNPQADAIHRLLEQRGERVVNDHIALRTFDDPRVNIDVLARPFETAGYRAAGRYEFKQKKLSARHFEHDDKALPRVFISELQLSAFDESLRSAVAGLLDQVDAATLGRDDLPTVGRPWELSFADYQALAEKSEYAGWMSAFGFCANHFTVLVNSLKTFDSLEGLCRFLADNGFELNASGGLIKGSPGVYLEQASTLADKTSVTFSDGAHTIPACYYEFARRYPMPNGELFGGFVTGSTDKIFESTDRR